MRVRSSLWFRGALLCCNTSFADGLRVVDGDTININGERIRFGGIDAPETNFWYFIANQ